MLDRRSVSRALLVLLTVVGIATLAGAASATPQQVDSCQTLDAQGTYVLSSDIETTQDRCFDATADGVVLDGNGHTVTSSDGTGTAAVVAVGADSTVRDVTVTGWEFGVIASGSGSTITGVSGRSLDSAVASATQESGFTVRDVDGQDVGEVVLVDHATEVDVSEVTGDAVQNAIVEVRRGGGISVSDVAGSGGDKAGVYVERSAQVSVDAVQVRDALVGVSVFTTNGATVTDVTATNTTAGVQIVTSRNVTLTGASIRSPAADGISATNLTRSTLSDIDIEDAGDDGVVFAGGETLAVQNVSATVADAGLAALGTGSLSVDGLTVGNGSDAVVVRNATEPTLTDLAVEGVARSAVQVNDSVGTTVRNPSFTNVPTAFDFRNATDVTVTGGTYTDVDHVVAATESENVALSSLRLSNRLVNLDGDSFSVALVAAPPDGGERVVVPPMLNVTAVGDSGLDVLVDLNTDREYDAEDLGFYQYDDGWTRLEDNVDTDVPGVAVTLQHPASVAVLTAGSVPSARSPTPTASPTPTTSGPTEATPTDGTAATTPSADGNGFTFLAAVLAVAATAGLVRRRFTRP